MIMTDYEIYSSWKNSGKSDNQVKILSELNGCSISTIHAILSKYNVKSDSKKLPEDKIKKSEITAVSKKTAMKVKVLKAKNSGSETNLKDEISNMGAKFDKNDVNIDKKSKIVVNGDLSKFLDSKVDTKSVVRKRNAVIKSKNENNEKVDNICKMEVKKMGDKRTRYSESFKDSIRQCIKDGKSFDEIVKYLHLENENAGTGLQQLYFKLKKELRESGVGVKTVKENSVKSERKKSVVSKSNEIPAVNNVEVSKELSIDADEINKDRLLTAISAYQTELEVVSINLQCKREEIKKLEQLQEKYKMRVSELTKLLK